MKEAALWGSSRRPRPPSPSRQEVEARLLDLIEGRSTREEAASWAEQWVDSDGERVSDPAVWKALTQLSGADLKTIDRPYLHEQADFEAWLGMLRRA
jgi:hypothetical protein